jgi:hypothetical protein
MKKILLTLMLMLPVTLCFAQRGLVSYEDIKFMLHNNLQQVDTFLTIKGYVPVKKDNATKNREYNIIAPGDTHTDINVRLDGKRIFIEIQTNQISQYNAIHDSIIQFLDKNSSVPGVQTYGVKDLGTIYITVEDNTGDPLRKDYDIQIAGDKHITINN